MAELIIKRNFNNAADMINTVAKSSKYYNNALGNDPNIGFSYKNWLANSVLKDKDLSILNTLDFRNLSVADQFLYSQWKTNSLSEDEVYELFNTTKQAFNNSYGSIDDYFVKTRENNEKFKAFEAMASVEKIANGLGYGVAKLGAGIYGIGEDVADFIISVIGLAATGIVDIAGGDSDSVEEYVKNLVKTDLTGKDAIQEKLAEWGHDKIYWNKKYNGWKILGDVTESIGAMLPILVTGGGSAAVRLAGQAVYYGASWGSVTRESIKSNENLSLGLALANGAAQTTIELLTEMISPLDAMHITTLLKNGGKTAIGRIAVSALGEGAEEIVAELFEEPIQTAFNNIGKSKADKESLNWGELIENSLYAGLIGGITGGLLEGIAIAKVNKNASPLFQGMSKAQILYVQERLSSLDNLDVSSSVERFRLDNNLNEEDIINYDNSLSEDKNIRDNATSKSNFNITLQEQYKQAKESDAKKLDEINNIYMGLATLASKIGNDKFKKAFDLAVQTAEERANAIIDTTMAPLAVAMSAIATSKKTKDALNEYNANSKDGVKLLPTVIPSRFNDAKAAETFAATLGALTGKQVIFGDQIKIKEDNVSLDRTFVSTTLSDGTIVISSEAFNTMSPVSLTNEVLKNNICEDISKNTGLISDKIINQIKRVIPEAANLSKKDVIKLVLNDPITVGVLYGINKSACKNLYSYLANKSKFKNFKIYEKALKRYEAFVSKSILDNIPKENIEEVGEQLEIDDSQIQLAQNSTIDLIPKDNRSWTYIRADVGPLAAKSYISINDIRKTILREDVRSNEDIDFADPNSYNPDFVNQINGEYSPEEFLNNLNNYFYEKYGLVYSATSETFLIPFKLHEVFNISALKRDMLNKYNSGQTQFYLSDYINQEVFKQLPRSLQQAIRECTVRLGNYVDAQGNQILAFYRDSKKAIYINPYFKYNDPSKVISSSAVEHEMVHLTLYAQGLPEGSNENPTITESLKAKYPNVVKDLNISVEIDGNEIQYWWNDFLVASISTSDNRQEFEKNDLYKKLTKFLYENDLGEEAANYASANNPVNNPMLYGNGFLHESDKHIIRGVGAFKGFSLYLKTDSKISNAKPLSNIGLINAIIKNKNTKISKKSGALLIPVDYANNIADLTEEDLYQLAKLAKTNKVKIGYVAEDNKIKYKTLLDENAYQLQEQREYSEKKADEILNNTSDNKPAESKEITNADIKIADVKNTVVEETQAKENKQEESSLAPSESKYTLNEVLQSSDKKLETMRHNNKSLDAFLSRLGIKSETTLKEIEDKYGYKFARAFLYALYQGVAPGGDYFKNALNLDWFETDDKGFWTVFQAVYGDVNYFNISNIGDLNSFYKELLPSLIILGFTESDFKKYKISEEFKQIFKDINDKLNNAKSIDEQKKIVLDFYNNIQNEYTELLSVLGVIVENIDPKQIKNRNKYTPGIQFAKTNELKTNIFNDAKKAYTNILQTLNRETAQMATDENGNLIDIGFTDVNLDAINNEETDSDAFKIGLESERIHDILQKKLNDYSNKNNKKTYLLTVDDAGTLTYIVGFDRFLAELEKMKTFSNDSEEEQNKLLSRWLKQYQDDGLIDKNVTLDQLIDLMELSLISDQNKPDDSILKLLTTKSITRTNKINRTSKEKASILEGNKPKELESTKQKTINEPKPDKKNVTKKLKEKNDSILSAVADELIKNNIEEAKESNPKVMEAVEKDVKPVNDPILEQTILNNEANDVKKARGEDIRNLHTELEKVSNGDNVDRNDIKSLLIEHLRSLRVVETESGTWAKLVSKEKINTIKELGLTSGEIILLINNYADVVTEIVEEIFNNNTDILGKNTDLGIRMNVLELLLDAFWNESSCRNDAWDHMKEIWEKIDSWLANLSGKGLKKLQTRNQRRYSILQLMLELDQLGIKVKELLDEFRAKNGGVIDKTKLVKKLEELSMSVKKNKIKQKETQKTLDSVSKKLETIISQIEKLDPEKDAQQREELEKQRQQLEEEKNVLEREKARLFEQIVFEEEFIKNNKDNKKQDIDLFKDALTIANKEARGEELNEEEQLLKEILPVEEASKTLQEHIENDMDSLKQKYEDFKNKKDSKWLRIYKNMITFKYVSMLSSPSTWVKNWVSNWLVKYGDIISLTLSDSKLINFMNKYMGINPEYWSETIGEDNYTITFYTKKGLYGNNRVSQYKVSKNIKQSDDFKNFISDFVYTDDEHSKRSANKSKHLGEEEKGNLIDESFNKAKNKNKNLTLKIKDFIDFHLNATDNKFILDKTRRLLGQLLLSNLSDIYNDCYTVLKELPKNQLTTEQIGFRNSLESWKNDIDSHAKEIINIAMTLNDQKLSGILTVFKDYAYSTAEKTFFRNRNKAGELFSRLQREHPVYMFLPTVLQPFFNMSVNMTNAILEWSPAGFLMVLQKKSVWNKMVKSLAENKEIAKQSFEGIQALNEKLLDFEIKTKEKLNERLEELKKDLEVESDNSKRELYVTLLEVSDRLNLYEHNLKKADKAINETVSNVSGFESIEIRQELARATISTGLLALSIILSALGVFKIDDDDYLGPCLNVCGFKARLTDLAPMTSVLAVGTSLYNLFDSYSTDANKTFAASLVENTFLEFMVDAIEYSDDWGEFVLNTLSSSVTQFIPAVFKKVNSIFDHTKSVKSTSPWKRAFEDVIDAIPILRFVLPRKIDPYTGNPSNKYDFSYTGTVFAEMISAFAPIKWTWRKPESYKSETKQIGAIAGSPTGRFKYGNKEYNLKGKDLQAYQKYRGNLIKNNLSKVIESNKYKKANSELKKQLIKAVYNNATSKTKEWWAKNNK